MNGLIRKYLDMRLVEIDSIPVERQELIAMLADYIAGRILKGFRAKLIFICTHNSRRSILGQVWAMAAADYFGISIDSYSGGTEATAFYPSAVKALENAGFTINRQNEPPNPVYEIKYGEASELMKVFSKRYDDLANPNKDFAAIMTCSDADEACPYIPGADIRIPLRYDDPKIYDGTPHESAAYDERCAQIAREMSLLFRSVREILDTKLV